MFLSEIRKICSNFSYQKLSAFCYSTGNFFPRNNSVYNVLPGEKRSKIIYSSFLENLELNKGYIQNKIHEQRREKTDKICKLNRSKIRPFPVALNQLHNQVQESYQVDDNENQKILIPEISVEEDFPTKWMNDYEFYDESKSSGDTSFFGTPDSSIPASRIPCNGCGSYLHCQNPSLPGYVPTEIFLGRTEIQLKQIQCQRCHFLKHYNIALDVAIPPETYVKTLSSIQDKIALVILIVDLLDFPCSIWPNMPEILGKRRKIFLVGNKVDLLPKDSPGYLDYIKKCLKNEVIKIGFNPFNIKNVSLISAKTGYGIEELITQLHKIWSSKGDVYLVGCTNVGKSSLFNALLRSDYCKVEASDLVYKATTCPWPGTTLEMLRFPILRPSAIRIYHRFRRLFSERSKRAAERELMKEAMKDGDVRGATLSGTIGRTFVSREETIDSFAMSSGSSPIVTLNERRKEYLNSKWCYDTPGIMQPDQVQHLLTSEELLFVQPKSMISPRAFRLDPGMSIFLAGLSRLDFLTADNDVGSIQIFVYSSHELPIVITPTSNADEVYREYLGTEIFGVPFGDDSRLEKWPGLKRNENDITICAENEFDTTCDIIFSSAGWIGLKIPKNSKCKFLAWTPYGKQVYIRNPPLIRLGELLIGKRVRRSLAYRIAKPFTQKKIQLRNFR